MVRRLRQARLRTRCRCCIRATRSSSFDLAGERADLIVKMSWVIMREDGDWKILNHHASSKQPLI
jgi:hypothetical protein